MIYLSGVVRPDLPAMLTPRMGQRPPEGQVWAADNGRYASPQDYTDEKYLAWLAGMPAESCLFATAPDVWGDAVATMALSVPMLPVIRAAGYRAALVAQDGVELLPVPWDDFDALFIGGSDGWRHSDGLRDLVADAKRRGKWVHMGRVNSLRRMRYAESIGCDSADGTVLKHDPSRPVHEWGAAVRTRPSLWGGR
jgi:hypothetical protein